MNPNDVELTMLIIIMYQIPFQYVKLVVHVLLAKRSKQQLLPVPNCLYV